jgi:hypothetical protein
MNFLNVLLTGIRKCGKDKIVLISNFTETLKVVSSMLKQKGYQFYQLDGKTPVKKRQELVDEFNRPDDPKCVKRNFFLFLVNFFFSLLEISCVFIIFQSWWCWIKFNWGESFGFIGSQLESS